MVPLDLGTSKQGLAQTAMVEIQVLTLTLTTS